ncbi:hypothetical protein NUW58_g2698 [Xylaria curta]|uniref:Uncharacterized protein n=1 Tax=Xylaria curta TaxID=42375 RepID=A0ACC1PEC8_9PEZI|nr:hypothetical protein NUW58_g2698 [Xylaria curta]
MAEYNFKNTSLSSSQPKPAQVPETNLGAVFATRRNDKSDTVVVIAPSHAGHESRTWTPQAEIVRRKKTKGKNNNDHNNKNETEPESESEPETDSGAKLDVSLSASLVAGLAVAAIMQ